MGSFFCGLCCGDEAEKTQKNEGSGPSGKLLQGPNECANTEKRGPEVRCAGGDTTNYVPPSKDGSGKVKMDGMVKEISLQKTGRTAAENKNLDTPLVSADKPAPLVSADKPVEAKMDQIMEDAKKTNGSKINMFKKAINREFVGMYEKDESKWQGNYDFICMGDPQFGMSNMEREAEFSRRAVAFINMTKPKFVVVCGDHTHSLEGIWTKPKGDVEAGNKRRTEELRMYKDVYSKLDEDIPLVCVCGNHDVGNAPTNKTVQMYKDEFGDDYLAFWCGGVKYICINSQIIQGLEENDELALAHEQWFDKELAKDSNTPVHLLAFCHIPPFCFEPEEKDTNFNWPKGRREKWLEKMVGADVKKVYCAHYHYPARGEYKGLEVVVTSAVGTHIKRKDVPEEIKEDRLKAANFLLGFSSFGGIETNEDTSGLQVVSVTKEGLTEKWLNITKINEEINGAQKST